MHIDGSASADLWRGGEATTAVHVAVTSMKEKYIWEGNLGVRAWDPEGTRMHIPHMSASSMWSCIFTWTSRRH